MLSQFVTVPTYGDNTLDLILTACPSNIYNVELGPPLGCSEKNHLHATLVWNFFINGSRVIPHFNERLGLNRTDFTKLNALFNKIDWQVEFYDKPVNECYIF